MGVGSEIGQICGVFSSKDSKMHIFLTFLNGYIHPNNFKNKKQAPWGFAPNPTLTCEAAGAGGKPYPPTPTVSVVDSKASRVKCTTSSPLTPLHLRGGSKTNRSGRSWKPVKACEANRVAAWPLQVGGDPTLCGKGAGGFSLHPLPRGERGWGSAHGVGKTLGGRAVGENVP